MAVLAALPILLIAEPLTALHRRGIFLPGYGREAYDRIINIIVGPLFTVAVVASIAITARYLDRRPLADFGLTFDRHGWRSLALGLILGAALMLLIFAAEYVSGMLVVTGFVVRNLAGVGLGLALIFSLVKVLCVGVYEECFSRGYLLRNLADGINLPAAVILTSAIFALLHATNDNASVMSTLGLFVNGLLFAAAVLATGRLSAAIGLHISWNLFEGVVLGFPVSGDKEGASLIGIHQLGPPIVTGGAFGPEAGVIGIAASLLGIVALLVVSSDAYRPFSRGWSDRAGLR